MSDFEVCDGRIGTLDATVLRAGPARCVVAHFGATLVSWQIDGVDQLFASEKALMDGSQAIRGGIPLVFPQFGPGALPNHGFARTTVWTRDDASKATEADSASVAFDLMASDETRKLWPHAFALRYTVSLRANGLKTDLTVRNTGAAPFEFQALQHTYFRVADVTKATVRGLAGLTAHDKLTGAESEPAGDDLAIGEEVDRVYRVADPARLSAGLAIAADGVERFAVSVSAAEEAGEPEAADVVVWNPWVEKSKRMADFGDDEYLSMLCIEPGHVAASRALAPGAAWTLTQDVRPARL